MFEPQPLIEAEHSEIFYVLLHIACDTPPWSRATRVLYANSFIRTEFDAMQHAFLDLVLSHYVELGVDDLSTEKLTSLLK